MKIEFRTVFTSIVWFFWSQNFDESYKHAYGNIYSNSKKQQKKIFQKKRGTKTHKTLKKWKRK